MPTPMSPRPERPHVLPPMPTSRPAPRCVDHAQCRRRHVADRKGGRGIPVEPIETRRHVDVHDVTRPKDLLRARDAVTDDVVAARAHRGRKALVPELARRAPERACVLAHPPIDVGRRNAGPDSLGDERERLGGRAPGVSHAFNFGLAENLDHALALCAPRPPASKIVWISPPARCSSRAQIS